MSRWLLSFLLVAGLASAQSVSVRSQHSASGLGPSVSKRSVTLCLVPDIQNLSSSNEMSGGVDGETSCGVDASYCTGASCVKSPYCHITWANTGAIMLRNLAYSLTGRWEQIDYSLISGGDKAAKNLSGPPDHARCDAIIGLGDSYDSISATGNPTYAALTAKNKRQVDQATDFWRIIHASGIPYLIARGNHDPELVFRAMLTNLGVAGTSFYHAGTEDQYAIKFATASGKQFCALAADNKTASPIDPGEVRTAAETTWITDNTGCGANLPTIAVSHQWVTEIGGLTSDAQALIDDAALDEIFLLAGGHFTPNPALSVKSSTTNVGGNIVVKMFSNFQETDRHSSNVGGTGITASDGNGGQYTVVTISPGSNRICGHDWNPYWQVRDGISNGQVSSAAIGSEACFSLPFDARFP